MVPGLGLYLKELFFDRYHVKLDMENEKQDLAKQKLMSKSAAVSDEALQACSSGNSVCSAI